MSGSDESTGPIGTVRRQLAELTGFEYPVFVQSGTAALQLALRTLCPRRASVAIPAWVCWSVPHAIDRAGMQAHFCDIDEWWGMVPPTGPVDAIVSVDPLASPGNWTDLPADPVKILDACQAPGATVGGAKASERFDAAILSFSGGKPIDIGGGGVVLFKDHATQHAAIQHLAFGQFDGAWRFRTDRYLFSSHLFAPLARELSQRIEGLASMRESAEQMRALVTGQGDLIRSVPLRPGGAPGLWSFTALCLPADREHLELRDIEAAAFCERVKLARHPISVAYREPAWDVPFTSEPCPTAESLMGRVLFSRAGAPEEMQAALRLVRRTLARPESFRGIFDQWRAKDHEVPAAFRHARSHGTPWTAEQVTSQATPRSRARSAARRDEPVAAS